MILTQEERDKFATYLEEDAASNDGLIVQATKVGGMEPLIQKLKIEAASARIIARKLRTTESMSL